MEELAKDYFVIALDRAGYGGSELLNVDIPEIEDYARSVGEELDALGIEGAVFYGSATGAVVALELSRQDPERFDGMILENLPVVSEEEREYLIRHYSPRLEPQWDGGHLSYLWQLAHDIHVFWPWSRRMLVARRDIDMPPLEHIQETVLELLVAARGELADAVWRYSVPEALAAVAVPLTILCRADAIMARHLDRYPKNPFIDILPTPRDDEFNHLWFSKPSIIKQVIDRCGPRSKVREPEAWPMIPGRVAKGLVTSHGRQVCVRANADVEGTSLVVLHRAPESGRQLEPLLLALSATRPVYCIDIPGLGDSDPLAVADAPLEVYADAVFDAILQIEHQPFDLCGEGTAALIALEIAVTRPESVRSVIFNGGIPLFSDEERDDLLRNYCVSLEPRWDGTHLGAGWFFLQASELFWPWYKRTRDGIRWIEPADAAVLHARFVDLVKAASSYAGVYRAAFRYPARERLRDLGVRSLLVQSNDRFTGYLDEALRLMTFNAVTVADDRRELSEVVEEFLGGLN